MPERHHSSILNCLKHFLRHRLLSQCPFQFLSGVLQVFQPFQFILCILTAKMSLSVKHNPYITMPHKVLQRLWIHAGFRHIAAIRMPANMRRDIGHLHPINIVVPLHHMIKPMFPVHCHQWQAFVIQKQEPIMVQLSRQKSEIFIMN